MPSYHFHCKAVNLHRFIDEKSGSPLDFALIERTEDRLSSDFFDKVKMLQRPYLMISETEFNEVCALTNGHGDILKFDHVKMTFGTPDGGFALMPLTSEHQDDIFFVGNQF